MVGAIVGKQEMRRVDFHTSFEFLVGKCSISTSAEESIYYIAEEMNFRRIPNFKFSAAVE